MNLKGIRREIFLLCEDWTSAGAVINHVERHITPEYAAKLWRWHKRGRQAELGMRVRYGKERAILIECTKMVRSGELMRRGSCGLQQEFRRAQCAENISD